MNVHVQIECVTLDGVRFGAAERAILARVLSGELRTLIEAQGIPPALISTRSVRRLRSGPGSIPVAPGPAVAGRSIARAVYSSFGQA